MAGFLIHVLLHLRLRLQLLSHLEDVLTDLLELLGLHSALHQVLVVGLCFLEDQTICLINGHFICLDCTLDVLDLLLFLLQHFILLAVLHVP